MSNPENESKGPLNRRDFNRLAMAAFSGVVTGSLAGCAPSEAPAPAGGGKKDREAGSGKEDPKPESGTEKPGSGKEEPKAGTDPKKEMKVAANDWTGDTHVCRGLNACKAKGADGKNDCAGKGACATAKAHACHTHNDCKYQGGCGATVAQNGCKGKGECAVPLSDGAWKTARTSFEAAMKKAKKKFSDAPAKKKKES